MKNFLPYQVSGINALLLILIGSYGYLQSSSPSPTALIPVGFGIILLAMNKGIKAENKIIAHIAVTATLLILIGLIMPLKSALAKSDTGAIFRVSIMLISTVLAKISFVQSFIRARKERENSN